VLLASVSNYQDSSGKMYLTILLLCNTSACCSTPHFLASSHSSSHLDHVIQARHGGQEALHQVQPVLGGAQLSASPPLYHLTPARAGQPVSHIFKQQPANKATSCSWAVSRSGTPDLFPPLLVHHLHPQLPHTQPTPASLPNCLSGDCFIVQHSHTQLPSPASSPKVQ
jgi:hypothetical protein